MQKYILINKNDNTTEEFFNENKAISAYNKATSIEKSKIILMTLIPNYMKCVVTSEILISNLNKKELNKCEPLMN